MNGKGEMLSVQLVLPPHFFLRMELKVMGFSKRTALTNDFQAKLPLHRTQSSFLDFK